MNSFMNIIRRFAPGMAVSFVIAVVAWQLGHMMPVIGGPIFAILIGMIIAIWWNDKGIFTRGIGFTSKYILQAAVVLLGFGLDLGVVVVTGWRSLPIIVVTISVALLIAWCMKRVLSMTFNTATLVGVGSSICGGSAIAATAPVIEADDSEIAQSISVIFFFNVLAALFFPFLGHVLGMSTSSGDVFGLFAGTAVNDTSSVTAAASTWDTMWNLGTSTLDTAVTVKLTRTLAIIPITLVLGMYVERQKAKRSSDKNAQSNFSLKRAFPQFVGWFIIASLITTFCIHAGVGVGIFAILKTLSKFFVVMAMAAIGLNSNIVKLVKTGGKPLLLGALCWIGITISSLILMHLLGFM